MEHHGVAPAIRSLDSLNHARSFLFVPGHRDDRFAKAANSGADVIVLDLEDAVPPDAKPAARKNVYGWLSHGGTGVIRINGRDTEWHDEDIAMLEHFPCAVVLPMIAEPNHVAELLKRLTSGSVVLPLLETAIGILQARDICSMPGVARAVFGNADLAKELGISLNDHDALRHARSQVVLASAACGLPGPVDGVTTSLDEKQDLVADVEHAVSLGFGGKLCLHPNQVDIVNNGFSPSAEDLIWARKVIAAANDGSVMALNGQVVGKPVIDRARKILEEARRVDG